MIRQAWEWIEQLPEGGHDALFQKNEEVGEDGIVADAADFQTFQLANSCFVTKIAFNATGWSPPVTADKADDSCWTLGVGWSWFALLLPPSLNL